MLQQTTVVTVAPYFLKFIRRWPTVHALAAASAEEVRQMWAGLGYYRRARGLHECAQVICRDYGGVFPRDEKELLGLPGIGPYTAAALRAIGFDQRANVVDGNVERVMARLFAEKTPLPKAKAKLRVWAEKMLPQERYGDYAQALMDLGATVCTPRQPKCEECPWSRICQAKKLGLQDALPRRAAKKQKPVRRTIAFVIVNRNDEIWLRQRAAQGLLAHMMEVPSGDWSEGAFSPVAVARRQARLPDRIKGRLLELSIAHSFSHFNLECGVVLAPSSGKLGEGRWVPVAKLDNEALPSVMRKIIRYAIRDMEAKL
jgi:A/G-specific adenine glycosylase